MGGMKVFMGKGVAALLMCLLWGGAVWALPNPSAVFCADQGWRAAYALHGSDGYCLLPDGRYFEQWDLFRGKENGRYQEVVQSNAGKRTLDVLVQMADERHQLYQSEVASDHEQDSGDDFLDFCEDHGWLTAGMQDRLVLQHFCLLPNGRYVDAGNLWLGRESLYKEVVEQCQGHRTDMYLQQQDAITRQWGE